MKDLHQIVAEANIFESAESLAKFFHDTYEMLAPSFGYETRQDTREFNPESKNGLLMRTVCGGVLVRHQAAIEKATEWWANKLQWAKTDSFTEGYNKALGEWLRGEQPSRAAHASEPTLDRFAAEAAYKLTGDTKGAAYRAAFETVQDAIEKATEYERSVAQSWCEKAYQMGYDPSRAAHASEPEAAAPYERPTGEWTCGGDDIQPADASEECPNCGRILSECNGNCIFND